MSLTLTGAGPQVAGGGGFPGTPLANNAKPIVEYRLFQTQIDSAAVEYACLLSDSLNLWQFEMRTGDVADGPGGHRSEITGWPFRFLPADDIRSAWCFNALAGDALTQWLLIGQIHQDDASIGDSPPVAVELDETDHILIKTRNNAGTETTHGTSADPIDRGKWYGVSLRVKVSGAETNSDYLYFDVWEVVDGEPVYILQVSIASGLNIGYSDADFNYIKYGCYGGDADGGDNFAIQYKNIAASVDGLSIYSAPDPAGAARARPLAFLDGISTAPTWAWAASMQMTSDWDTDILEMDTTVGLADLLYDQSGNDNAAVQSTEANQPARDFAPDYLIDTLYDGAGDLMTLTVANDSSDLIDADAFYIIAIFDITATPANDVLDPANNNPLVFGENSASRQFGLVTCESADGNYPHRVQFFIVDSGGEKIVTIDGVLNQNQAVFVECEHTGTEIRMRVNGSAWESIAAGAVASLAGFPRMGHCGTSYQGRLYAAATWKDVPSEADRSTMLARFQTMPIAEPLTILGNLVPDTPEDAEPDHFSLGVYFQSDVFGSIEGIRFYKGGDTGGDSHVVTLYEANTNILAQASSASETESGWQEVYFDEPVPIGAGNLYIASVFWPNGYYPLTVDGFDGGYSSPPLSVGVNGGCYINYGIPAFPEVTSPNNYFTDVLFRPGVGVDPGPSGFGFISASDGGSLTGYAVGPWATDPSGLNGSEFGTATLNDIDGYTIDALYDDGAECTIVIRGDFSTSRDELSRWAHLPHHLHHVGIDQRGIGVGPVLCGCGVPVVRLSRRGFLLGCAAVALSAGLGQAGLMVGNPVDSVFNNGRSQLNLGFPQFGGAFPFLNHAKDSQQWQAINTGLSVAPDTLDINGYPTTIVDGGVQTIFYIPPASDRPGNWRLTWEGTGTITAAGGGGAATDGSYTFAPSEDLVPQGNRVLLRITATNGDLDNLRFFHEDDEALLDAGEIFNTKFLDVLRSGRWGVIRFLDWQAANLTNVVVWADRKSQDYVFWTGEEMRAAIYAGATTNSGDDYSCSAPPNWGGLVQGATVTVRFNANSTGVTPTLDVAGTGAKVIRDPAGNELHVNLKPVSGRYGTLVYNALLDCWLKNGGDGVQYFDQFLNNSIPIEVMLALCVKIGAHPWFCLPYLACDPITDWTTELATYLRENAPSWMVPRFEAAPNETWNALFAATKYAENASNAEWGAASYNQWVGKVASLQGQAVSAVYSDDRSRYWSIVGVQTISTPSSSDDRLASSNYVMDGGDPAYDWVTHVACADYFRDTYSTAEADAAAVAYAAADTAGKLVIATAYVNSTLVDMGGDQYQFGVARLTTTTLPAWKSWATSFGASLTFYEGGWSPDYVSGQTDLNALKAGSRLVAELEDITLDFYDDIDTLGGDFPSHYYLSGDGVWALFDPTTYAQPSPQIDGIAAFNAQ